MALSLEEYERYGRQMIVSDVGLKGQQKIKNSKVLVVGAGGLGCPAIAYLSGAGVGHIGIVDGDIVEVGNLHRQILHGGKVGMYKSESAKESVKNINPLVEVSAFTTHLTVENALTILSPYDVVLDCTDTPATRYLINDACVLLQKPLVSASALRGEGQLAVFNYRGGPCYRCLFPEPPPPHAVTACGDGGIIGPVVGLMGTYQAIETLRVILDLEHNPQLLLFQAWAPTPFRAIRIRGRQANCKACGNVPTIEEFKQRNYRLWCGLDAVEPLDKQFRVDVEDFEPNDSQVVDVRPEVQFDMCHLPQSTNIPIDVLRKVKSVEELPLNLKEPLTVICRYGNDSQDAVRIFQRFGIDAKDLRGGLEKWSLKRDPLFPRY